MISPVPCHIFKVDYFNDVFEFLRGFKNVANNFFPAFVARVGFTGVDNLERAGVFE